MIGQHSRILAAACSIGAVLFMTACSGKSKSDVELTPRTQAVITFSPPSNEKFELRNNGPASVRMFIARSSGNAEILLGAPGYFMSSLGHVRSILLRNETQAPAELKLRIDSKDVDFNVERSPFAGE